MTEPTLKPAAECSTEECCRALESLMLQHAADDCPCDFPRQIPWTCIRHLLAMFNGTEPRELSTILRHAGCAMGSLGALMDRPVYAMGGEEFQSRLLEYLLKILMDLLGNK